MAQPTDPRMKMSTARWPRRRRAISLALVAALLALVLSILGGLGTRTSGVPNLASQAVLAASGFAPAPHVASEANLRALAVGLAPATVIRDGYATANDGGRGRYAHSSTPCALNAGAGDDGSQVTDSTGAGCWLLDPSDPIRPEQFGPRRGNSASTYDDGPRVLAAYRALCARAGSTGSTLRFLGTQYYFGSTKIVMNVCPVAFVGERPSEVPLRGGTWFHVNAAAQTPFSVNAGLSKTPIGDVAGFSFEHIGFYQDQPVPAGGQYPPTQPSLTGYTPKAYPAVIALGAAGQVRLDDIRAYPVYQFLWETNTGRLELGALNLQCLSYCFNLDQTFDVVHLTGAIHQWPFWSNNVNVTNYQYNNADLFRVGEVDGMDGGNIFGYAMHSIFTFDQGMSKQPTNYSTRWNLNSVYADSVFQAIRSMGGSQPTEQAYPEHIHINAMDAGCAGPGVVYAATNAAPGSAGIYVGPAGALDITFGSLGISGCGGSPADAAISLNNPNLPSSIQVGTLDVEYQGGAFFKGPWGPVVSSVTPTDYLKESTVVFSSPPNLKWNGQTLLPNRAPIYFKTAQFASGEASGIADNATIFSDWRNEEYVLESAASSNTGSTFFLPSNPWEGEKIRLIAAQPFTSFTVATNDGSSILKAPTRLLAHVPVTFYYRSGLNQWWAGS